MTAPIAPQGTSHPAMNQSAFLSIASNSITVKAMSTPPPKAISA